MARRCLALVPLFVSVALHAALVLVLAGSASGAEPDFSGLQAPRLVGNTFEIETLQESEARPAQVTSAPASIPVESPAAASPKLAPTEKVSAPARDVLAQPNTADTPEAEKAADRPRQPEPEQQVATPPTPLASQQAAAAGAVESELPAMPVTSQSNQAPTVDSAAGPAISAANELPAPPVYGQASLPAHVGSLAKAFTRAVPRAAFRDPVWHRLPVGALGKVIFSIELDNTGKVVGAASVERTEPEPPVFLKSLVARTVLMLKAGTFALTPQGIEAGAQRFELSAELRRVEALDDVIAAPEDLRQIGRLVEPTRVRPGKANFTYNSGRQVELTIRMLAE